MVFLSWADSGVELKISFPGEPLGACSALVWLEVCVPVDVLDISGVIGEALSADVAVEFEVS